MNYLVLVLTLIVLAVLPTQAHEQKRITLRFEKIVELNANTAYSVLDIAQVENASRSEIEILKQVDATNLVTFTKTLTPAEIIPVLRPKLTEKNLDVSFIFSNFVSFKKVVDVVSIKHFTRLISPYLRLDCIGCDIELSANNQPWHVDQWSVSEVPQGLQTSMTLPIRISNSQSFRWLSFRIQAWKDIPVLIKPVVNGEAISFENVGIKKFDMAIRRNIVTEPGQIIGRKIQGTMAAQLPIEVSRIAKEYLVRRGQKTRGVVGDGIIEVSTTVEALQDGVQGDIIRVRQDNNKKELQAKVVDGEVVRIQ